jgi:NAD(P)-dependent dehydrogenase (short-subunit alcohol dehydrogenase family)
LYIRTHFPTTYINTMASRFRGQIVFITGGTSGIGLEAAIEFAKAGAEQVVVCGRTLLKWQLAQQRIQQSGAPNVIQYVPCDVRVETQVAATIANLYTTFGRVNVCVNNAGVQPVYSGDITQVHFESAQDADGAIVYRLPQPGHCAVDQTTPVSPFCESPIATSVFGVLYCLKWELAYARQYQPQGQALSIVNTATRLGIIPIWSRPIYSASKAFVISLTRSVATQVAQWPNTRIRINAVAPGPVDTPLERAEYNGPNWEQQASAGTPLGRVAQVQEIAPSILFLADEKTNSYITGSVLVCDGGFTSSPLV